MPRINRCFLIFILFVVAALALQAQTAPIKPGLWQAHMEREVNGQKIPDMSERLKNLPPAQRAQYEAMMKQRGMGNAGGDGTQVCYTNTTLDRSAWAKQSTDCKVDFSSP